MTLEPLTNYASPKRDLRPANLPLARTAANCAAYNLKRPYYDLQIEDSELPPR